jgi:type II secretory pathway pseudopilin PulG
LDEGENNVEASCQRGPCFTLLEMGFAGAIGSVVILAGFLGVLQTMNKTQVGTTAAMLNQDLKQVCSVVELKNVCPGTTYPYRYGVKFNGEKDTPSNSYCILKGTPDRNKQYTYQVVDPNEFRANSNSGNGWIKPTDPSVKIEFPSRNIYFFTSGSMTTADCFPTGTGSEMTIKVSSSNNGLCTENIKVTADGSVVSEGNEEE